MNSVFREQLAQRWVPSLLLYLVKDSIENTEVRFENIQCSTRAPFYKVHKNTVASIILKWKKFGTTKTLPIAGQTEQLGRRAWVREVNKNLMFTLTDLHRSSVETGDTSRSPTVSVALDQSGLYGRVARWKPLLSTEHLLSTFLKHLWQRLQLRVFLNMTLQAWHTCIWGVSPILCRSC